MRNPFRIGTAIYLRPLEPEDVPSLTDWTTQPAIRTALDLFYRRLDQSAAELFLERTKTTRTISLLVLLRGKRRPCSVSLASIALTRKTDTSN